MRQRDDLAVKAADDAGDDDQDEDDDHQDDQSRAQHLLSKLSQKLAGILPDDQMPVQLGNITGDQVIFTGTPSILRGPEAVGGFAFIPDQ